MIWRAAMCKTVDDKSASAYLQIERGGPYERGACIPLEGNAFIVGRSTNLFSADISFVNLLISRKHCRVKHFNGEWTISDLESKHGTAVNDQQITALTEYVLKSGDKIVLADGIVVLRFITSLEFDKTLDFDSPVSPVAIDLNRMTLIVDHQEVSLSVKEWLFVEVLYRHRSEFVSYEEIRRAVWAERYSSDENFPIVGLEEINMLIYRLRRKLGKHSKIIKTIRGRGCLLEL